MLKIKKFRKVWNYCDFINEYRGTTHITCVLKYSLATEISILFRNDSNYDYQFCQKQVSKKNNLLVKEKILKNTKHFQFLYKEKLQELIKMEITKLYLTDYNLLMMQYLWQAQYLAWSISLLKELIKLNVNTSTTIKYVKLVEISNKYSNRVLEYTDFKAVLIECRCLCCNKNYQKTFNKMLNERLFNAYSFSNNDISQFILS